jgi:hypothetical protein
LMQRRYIDGIDRPRCAQLFGVFEHVAAVFVRKTSAGGRVPGRPPPRAGRADER